MKARLRTVAGAFLFLILVTLSVWYSFFRISNEIGPLGADKTGRQIMIQSIESEYQRANAKIRVDSEWNDTSFFGRLFQEPMRTTIRIVIPSDAPQPDPVKVKAYLDSPYADFLFMHQGQISLRAEWTKSPEEVDRYLKELGAATTGDLFSAWGFRQFEIFHGKERVFGVELPAIGRGNVKHIGGE